MGSSQQDMTGEPTPIIGYFRDEYHAIKTGMLIGTLMKADVITRPETDEDGNFMPKIMIELPATDSYGPPTLIWIRVLSGPDAL
jgi:hypothetical protein